MKDYLAKLPLDEWRQATKELLKGSFLEEAWIDESMQVLGGQFSGASEVEVVLQLRSSDYRFSCDSCMGRFCPHVSALVEFYLEDPDSFMPIECSNRLINSLVKKSWGKYELKTRKRNLRSLKRKLEMMQDGLSLAEELYEQLFRLLPKVNFQEELFSLREQVERLGEYHLSGLVGEFKKVISSNKYSMLRLLVRLREDIAAIKKNLVSQLNSESLDYLDSESYAFMGHIWKVDELAELHPPESGSFLQLAFRCEENNYLERLEDRAVWLNLKNGELCHSVNLRPYKSLRHLKAEDSSDMVLECHEYFRYPGKNNYRVRWQSAFARKEGVEDYRSVINYSREDWDVVIKEAKKHLQSPIKGSAILFLLKFERFELLNNEIFLRDQYEGALKLINGDSGELVSILRTLPKDVLRDGACLIEAIREENGAAIIFKALGLVSSTHKIRLTL